MEIRNLSAFFCKKKHVKATLTSKVKEPFREIRVYNNTSLTANKPAPGYGGTSKKGLAYRLYFCIDGKYKEFDVTEKIFDNLIEGSIGMLTYKGCFFYSFDTNSQSDILKNNISDKK